MRRLLTVLGCLTMLLSVSALPAAADHNGSQPSDSAELCEAAGGEFTDLGDGTTTCAVDSFSEVPVAASHSSGNWTATIRVTTTTTYVTTTTVVPGAQVGCTNPQGNPVGGWESNPNCDPNNPDRNEAFTPIYGEPTVITEHSSSSAETNREQIGCNNSSGNPVGGWATNPNCVPAA